MESLWDVDCDVSTASSGDEVDRLRVAYLARWFVAIGAVQSSLLSRIDVASKVRFVIDRLLCSLIIDIHAPEISIPLSLLMLLP